MYLTSSLKFPKNAGFVAHPSEAAFSESSRHHYRTRTVTTFSVKIGEFCTPYHVNKMTQFQSTKPSVENSAVSQTLRASARNRWTAEAENSLLSI